VHIVTEEKDEQLRFQARLLEAVGQSVIATDLEGKVLYWNRAAEEIYGWSSEEALGRRLRDLTVSEESLQKAVEVDSELRAGRTWSGEILLRRKDGSYVPVLGTATPVFDDRGNLVGMIGVSTDISERKALEEELERRASHDPLTGLPNRDAFVDRLGMALQRTRRGKEGSNKVGVLFMDLDGFKTINDSLGHEAGDRLLVTVAERLKNRLRPKTSLRASGGTSSPCCWRAWRTPSRRSEWRRGSPSLFGSLSPLMTSRSASAPAWASLWALPTPTTTPKGCYARQTLRCTKPRSKDPAATRCSNQLCRLARRSASS
jgi:PAS domain S-box-containing protein